MRRRIVTTLSLLFFFVACIPPRVTNAKEAITWMEVSMPPLFIQDGPAKGQGYGDIISAIIQEQLPDYYHYKMVTNVIRHFDRFKKGENVCAVGLYPTPERKAFMYFSTPRFLALPAGLIIKKEKLATFDHSKSISLDRILSNKNFIIGLSQDRSYGNNVDALLKKYRNRENLVLFSGQELSGNYFKMLLLDRVDGLIGLPTEAMYHAEKLGIRDRIVTLTIEENQNDYEGWFYAIGCPKNEWGLGIINKINKILRTQQFTERYHAAYERWLDANSVEQYRKIYQKAFLHTTPQNTIPQNTPKH